MKISATIIVLNEENNISGCLESLDFADEIIVVDSGSTDRTKELCTSFAKVKYFEEPWLGFGRQKNLAASLASNDWIFNIDADERVSRKLLNSIQTTDLSMFSAFRVARKNYFGECWVKYCGWYPDYNIRLYNRETCQFSDRLVHESVETDGPVSTLEGDLVHLTYKGIEDFLVRMNKYSTLASQELVKKRSKIPKYRLLLSPSFNFFKMYILKLGILQGYHGFLLSVLYSYYTFAKYAKALEMQRYK